MNVFMFHFGRCGSTALGDAISRIPGFVWHGEIFSDGTHVFPGFEALELAKKKGRGHFECQEFLEFINVAKQGVERRIGYSIMHYGCEIKGYHFAYKCFNFSLDEALIALAARFPEAKFVFLRRRNSLRRIISSYIARQTGIYHVTTSVDHPNKLKINLDDFADVDLHCYGEITAVLRNSASAENQYSDVIQKHGGFEICYEDHIEGSMDGAMDLLSQKLNVQRVEPKTQLKKTNPYPLSEMIENYHELRQRLLTAKMESCLD